MAKEMPPDPEKSDEITPDMQKEFAPLAGTFRKEFPAWRSASDSGIKQVSVHDLVDEIKAYMGENKDMLMSWPDFISELGHLAPTELTDIAKTAPELARIMGRVLSSVNEGDLATAKVELLNVVDNLLDATKIVVTDVIKELPDTLEVNYDDEDEEEAYRPPVNRDDRSWEKRLDEDAAERAERIKKEFAAWKPGDPPTDVQKLFKKADEDSVKGIWKSPGLDAIQTKIAKLQSDEIELMVQLAVKEALGKADAAVVINSVKFRGIEQARHDRFETHLARANKSIRAAEKETFKKTHPKGSDSPSNEPSDAELLGQAIYLNDCITGLITSTGNPSPLEIEKALDENALTVKVLNKLFDDGLTIADVNASAARIEREDKLSLAAITDDVKSIFNTREAVTEVIARANNPLSSTLKENTMSTAKPETTAAATPHVISEAAMAVSAKVRTFISIDPTTGVTSFGKAKFEDVLDGCPANLDEITRSLQCMNIVSTGVSHAIGMEAAKFTKVHDKLEHVTGKFPGPNRGSHLAVSYKPTTTMPSGDGTKVYKGVLTTSWKGIGGPGGKDYDAVKEAVRAAAEASQAS